MRNYLLVVFMVLLLGGTTATFAQQKEQPQVGNVTNIPDTAGIEAYSDTTSVDTAQTAVTPDENSWNVDLEDEETVEKMFKWFNNHETLAWIFIFIVTILCFLIGLAPFIILGFIIYLIVKNRRMRSELNENADMNRQHLHDNIDLSASDGNQMLQNRGIKNIFLGIGIVIFLSMMGADKMAGIGWLMSCYGIGQVIIAKTSKKKDPTVFTERPKDTATKSSNDDFVEVKNETIERPAEEE